MDKTLSLKTKEFKKALGSLDEALSLKRTDIVRDSAIKRFEYSFELSWKTAKVFLKEKFGIEIASPKECFREMRKNKLILDEETEKFLKMTDDRNEIIHTYIKNFSNELYDKISEEYFELLTMIYGIVTTKDK